MTTFVNCNSEQSDERSDHLFYLNQTTFSNFRNQLNFFCRIYLRSYHILKSEANTKRFENLTCNVFGLINFQTPTWPEFCSNGSKNTENLRHFDNEFCILERFGKYMKAIGSFVPGRWFLIRCVTITSTFFF